MIRQIDPEHVPVQYIIMAKIKDFSGEERIVRGEELVAFMKDPQASHIAEARVIFNVKKMRKDIIAEVEGVFGEVNRLLLQSS
ncbi:MAG: hypothetical protein EOP83_12815 [Verrucomicrobiaceae bacterium]|nr:MAG: hypothetical protein EOP83_12815 [Verrucomicrobiaceae bacterium]